MGKTLQKIAQELKDSQKKVQLIYAFNGTGKTRLSREFKELFPPQQEQDDETETKMKVIYYNAFTEDLFHWDNDSDAGRDRKLLISQNSFTNWVLREEGQDANIINNFQHYTNDKLMPNFSEDYAMVSFSLETGDDQNTSRNIKISRGEESCFIWCVFYSLFQQIVGILNIAKEDRSTSKFNDLEYIFIDDPVSSLDENHLIEMAVNITELIKLSKSENLKFIITTHNPLFYNILYSELGVSEGYLLRKNEDQSLEFEEKKGDSNQSFSYHLFLKKTLEDAIKTNSVQKYHFTLLRNLYEKTANFLGYPRWAELLPDDKQLYYRRIIQFTSHSTLSNDTIAEPTDPEKQIIKRLLDHLVGQYQFKQN